MDFANRRNPWSGFLPSFNRSGAVPWPAGPVSNQRRRLPCTPGNPC